MQQFEGRPNRRRHPWRAHGWVGGATTIALLAGLAIGIADPARSAQSTPDLPSAVPSDLMPAVNNGAVYAIAQVDNQIVLGGSFTSVTPKGGVAVARHYLVAFDATTGALNTGFAPQPSAQVRTLAAGPYGTVYVGGDFREMNGVAIEHISQLRLSDGQVVPEFSVTNNNGRVNDLELIDGHLIAGGAFTSAGGKPHGGLASFDPTTGALQDWMQLQVSERHNDHPEGAVGPVRVDDLEVNADRTRLIAIGNFKKVDGLVRDQIVMADLTPEGVAVSTTWVTNAYAPLCNYVRHDSYVRKVDFSPDGSYLVVTSTGGNLPGSLCDSASRFETNAVGADLDPTWETESGADTLWGLAVTDGAVFIGGHNRWLNNPTSDRAGQGAVPRPGLAALDPLTGLPLAWNPGRNPRGKALYTMLATPAGLWIGSDTEYIGDREYLRKRVAFFPYEGGTDALRTDIAVLPATVYIARPNGRLLRTLFDGTTATPLEVQSKVSWGTARGATFVGDRVFLGRSDRMLYSRTKNATAFAPQVAIDPYNDPYWSNVDTGSGETYRGQQVLLYRAFPSITSMGYHNGRMYYTRQGYAELFWRSFVPDSGILGASVHVGGVDRDWTNTAGLFFIGSDAYVVDATNGDLLRMAVGVDGPTGAPVVVNGPATGGINWRGNAVFAVTAG